MGCIIIIRFSPSLYVLLAHHFCHEWLAQIVEEQLDILVPEALVRNNALAPACTEVAAEGLVVLQATLYANSIAHDACLVMPRVFYQRCLFDTFGEECRNIYLEVMLLRAVGWVGICNEIRL